MKKVSIIFLFQLLSICVFAQDCTREIAQSVPTILEKGFDNKPFSVKDAFGKKLGDNLFTLFAGAIQQSKGLHGNFNISEGNYHVPGLLGFHAYANMLPVYCTKDGKLDWKGLWDLGFESSSNYIIEDIGNQVSNEFIGTGGNHFVYLNNNIIYILNPRKSNSEISGYPYYEPLYSNSNNAVLVTKRTTLFFIPVSRKQYLELMKRAAEAYLVVQRKSLEESKKEKAGVEDAITANIDFTLNDIKEIDNFISRHNTEYLNKPCITDHNLETMFGKSFADDKNYFFDAPGTGKEWVIINPTYINTKLPASAPQFFSIRWTQGEKEVEKRAALLFKQTFDFKKMEDLLQ